MNKNIHYFIAFLLNCMNLQKENIKKILIKTKIFSLFKVFRLLKMGLKRRELYDKV